MGRGKGGGGEEKRERGEGKRGKEKREGSVAATNPRFDAFIGHGIAVDRRVERGLRRVTLKRHSKSRCAAFVKYGFELVRDTATYRLFRRMPRATLDIGFISSW